MQSINQQDRDKLDPLVAALAEKFNQGQCAAELRYSITKLVLMLLGPNPRPHDYYEVMGALEFSKQDLHHSAISPYITSKPIKENNPS